MVRILQVRGCVILKWRGVTRGIPQEQHWDKRRIHSHQGGLMRENYLRTLLENVNTSKLNCKHEQNISSLRSSPPSSKSQSERYNIQVQRSRYTNMCRSLLTNIFCGMETILNSQDARTLARTSTYTSKRTGENQLSMTKLGEQSKVLQIKIACIKHRVSVSVKDTYTLEVRLIRYYHGPPGPILTRSHTYGFSWA